MRRSPSWPGRRCGGVADRRRHGDLFVAHHSRQREGRSSRSRTCLIEQGIKIIDDGDALVHVSGHPRRGELGSMYEWIRPQISCRCTARRRIWWRRASSGLQAGIPQVAQVRNGDVLRLAPGPAEIIDKVPFGRVYKDGKVIGSEEIGGLRDRRKLSFAGHVAVNVVLDDGYDMAGDPDLVATGVAEFDREGDAIEDMMLDAAIGAVESIPRGRRKDLDAWRKQFAVRCARRRTTPGARSRSSPCS